VRQGGAGSAGGGQKAVPKEPSQPAGAKPAGSQAAKPEAVVLYSPVGKRDPFVPFLKVEPKEARQGWRTFPHCSGTNWAN
jgi:hypothetical protein